MIDMYIVALMTGLVGSLHCIGMCGPIAVALPLGKKSWGLRAVGSLTYNTGRTLTYGLLGGLFGLLGKGIQVAGLQQWASIAIGVIMIITVIFPAVFKSGIKPDRIFTGYAARLIAQFKRLFNQTSFSSLFIIGLLNGLLPCGLVYVAIAGAINTNEIVNGILYMIIFGLGTVPVMFIIPLVGNLVGVGLRRKLRGVVTVFILALGVLFILRGMSLGIPFVSPKTKVLQPGEQMMHHDNQKTKNDTVEMCH
jgi:sulfite exporter TauE/SafE